MYAQIEKPKQNQSSSVTNSIIQKKSNAEQGIGLVDNRSEAIQMRKLQETPSGGLSAINAIQLKYTGKSIPTAAVMPGTKEQMPSFYQKEQGYQEPKSLNKTNAAFRPVRSNQQTTQLQVIQKVQAHSSGCGCASCTSQLVQRKTSEPTTTVTQLTCDKGHKNHPKGPCRVKDIAAFNEKRASQSHKPHGADAKGRGKRFAKKK